LLLIPVPGATQDVTEPALKAAFVYNFAKFTDWPAAVVPPAAEPFVLCVVGDAAVADALERLVKGRVLAGHSMAVHKSPGAPEHVCHVIYLSGLTATQATQLVARHRDLPVLTISDTEGFTELGGIAQFFFEHGQLRFNIDVASARRAHLQISSSLLVLAKRR
jgi:hypothetical protein